ncbi:hypothetical protein [Streptomyces narbonensis]
MSRERFQEAFAATWTGEAENDNFNSLVLSAGLNWREALWCCAPTPSTCARPARPSARTTWTAQPP